MIDIKKLTGCSIWRRMVRLMIGSESTYTSAKLRKEVENAFVMKKKQRKNEKKKERKKERHV